MENKLNKIVIISGKGGTGKTTISAGLTKLFDSKTIVDCDVDASDLFLLFNYKTQYKMDFYSSRIPVIEKSKCINCGLCVTLCRFDAIQNYNVDKLACEGCGFCYNVCPVEAIKFLPKKSGLIFQNKIESNDDLVFAKLEPGMGNSGKLVAEIKKISENIIIKNNKSNMIIDGPPGIGCPVNASLTGTNYAVIVCEPTLSGISDFQRLLDLIKRFKTEAGVIINKFDLNIENTQIIESISEAHNLKLLGKISYDYEIVEKLQKQKTILECSQKIREEFNLIYNNIQNLIYKNHIGRIE